MGNILIESFVVSFISIFIMEMGDKTQLTSFTLTMRYKSRKKVFIGVTGGLTSVTFIAVILGIFLKQSIDLEILKPLIALIFCVAGIFIIYSSIVFENTESVEICPVSMNKCSKSIKEREQCKNLEECQIYIEEVIARNAIVRSYLFIFLAEIGDKSMLTALVFATTPNFDPISIFLGTIVALVSVNGIGIYFGEKMTKIRFKKQIEILSGGLFILIGLLLGLIN